jgi:hypothetical protein
VKDIVLNVIRKAKQIPKVSMLMNEARVAFCLNGAAIFHLPFTFVQANMIFVDQPLNVGFSYSEVSLKSHCLGSAAYVVSRIALLRPRPTPPSNL